MERRQTNLNAALANLLSGTRTHSRAISLADFYGWLKIAEKGLGSIEAVSERIGLSTRMIKQFFAYEKLGKPVQAMVKSKQITSVDAINYLAQFLPTEQHYIADLYGRKVVTSKDIRSIYEQRKQFPRMAIGEVVDRVKRGKTQKAFVLQFVTREGLTRERVKKSLSSIVGKENVLEASVEKPFGSVALTKEGLSTLRLVAKKNEVGLSTFIPQLLYAGGR